MLSFWSMEGCEVEDCTKPRKSKGRQWCSMHQARMDRHGNLDGLYPQGDPLDRLLKLVDKEGDGGCWLYVGTSIKNGYPRVREGSRPIICHYGHRLVYERMVGPIPEGNVVHHECEVKLCVNPDHLSCVTPKEHSRKHGLGDGPCKKGHSDWYYTDSKGEKARWCRECRRMRRAERRRLGLPYQ